MVTYGKQIAVLAVFKNGGFVCVGGCTSSDDTLWSNQWPGACGCLSWNFDQVGTLYQVLYLMQGIVPGTIPILFRHTILY